MNLKLWALIWLLSSLHSVFGQPPTPKPAERRDPAQAELPVSRVAGLEDVEFAPGVRANGWAAEPQLANPVAISFDHLGRLYVAETHRYGTSTLDVADFPDLLERDLASRTGADHTRLLESALVARIAKLGVESERVRVLEDTDRDGRADATHVVADGFSRASDGIAGGILADGDQVWLTTSPALWKLSNTDAPAVPQEIVGGLGVHIGSPTHGAHGVIMGPDGMLYFAMGDRGSSIPRPSGADVSVPDSGAVFRCAPDGSKVEVVALGLSNPEDLAFDDIGNLFAVESGEGSPARFIQIMEGGDYGWRVGFRYAPNRAANPWLDPGSAKVPLDAQPAYQSRAVGNIGDGPRGMVFHPGGGTLTEYRGTFFVGHVADRLADSGVRTYTIKPNGAGFVLSGSGTLLRGAFVTDVTFGPDSRLYVSDWVSRYPWPASERGRIYAVQGANITPADGGSAEATRVLIEQGMGGRSLTELAALLSHSDQRIRLAAQFAFASHGEASLPVLEKIATDAHAPRLARLHALWSAGQLAEAVPGALNHLPALLRDGDAEVRAQSAKLLGDYERFESFRSLALALKDPDPRVTFFTAQSLGKIKRTEAIPQLIELLRRNDDNDLVVRHAAVVALARLGAGARLANTVHDSSRAVRMGAVLVYRRLGDATVASFLQDSDSDIAREAAIGIYDSAIDPAMPALAATLEHAPLDDAPVILRAINAHFRLGRPENAKALAEFASRTYVPASFRAEALNRLAAWANPPARDGITGLNRSLNPRDPEPARGAFRSFISQMSGKTPEEVQVASIRVVAALQVPGTGHALWDVVFQDAHPVRARIAALQALEQLKDPRLDVAVQHATRTNKPELRLAAVPVLSRLNPAVSLPLLKVLVARGTAAELRAVFPVLGKITDEGADEILLSALHRLATDELPLSAQAELLEAARVRQNPAVSAEIKRIEVDWRASKDPLASYRSALAGGDEDRGRILFERDPELSCLKCHQRDIDRFRRASSWRNPSSEQAAKDTLLVLLNHPGSKEGGVLPESHAARKLVVSTKRDNARQGDVQSSREPADAIKALSPAALRDLVAYLVELRTTQR
jgi:quinoprotein glucose dehydrogenase